MSSCIDRKVFETLKEAAGEEFIGELVETFLDDAPSLIDQMKNALASQDADAFRRAAHSMKSNAATFGAMGLSAQAKELEMLGRDKNLNVGSKLQILEDQFRVVAIELKELK
jgi:HPt (histidine-containing phosphotransfer) domain-containing protein